MHKDKHTHSLSLSLSPSLLLLFLLLFLLLSPSYPSLVVKWRGSSDLMLGMGEVSLDSQSIFDTSLVFFGDSQRMSWTASQQSRRARVLYLAISSEIRTHSDKIRTSTNQWTRKHMNTFFTGLSRDFPGLFLRFLGSFVSTFPFSSKKKASHKQILTPPVPGTIPKSCLCLLEFLSPPKIKL